MSIEKEIRKLRLEIEELEKKEERSFDVKAKTYKATLIENADKIALISKNMYLVNVVYGKGIPFVIERFRVMIDFKEFNIITGAHQAVEYSNSLLEECHECE